MIERWLGRIALAAMITATSVPALADAWDALRAPGTVALVRHALAPGTGDPANFTLGDCSTQRNLDERGRAQARALGDAFRANGIAIDRVLTSQWCRCRETAELLALAPVEDVPALNSFFADRSTREAQTAAVRAILAELPEDRRAVLVTHFVNIRALTGRAVSSGEIVVVAVDDEGAVTVRGEIAVAP